MRENLVLPYKTCQVLFFWGIYHGSGRNRLGGDGFVLAICLCIGLHCGLPGTFCFEPKYDQR
jgi:hypothetical protein